MIKILVERLNEGPETLTINCAPGDLGIESEESYTFDAPVTGEIEFKLVGRDVQATGELHSKVGSQCARCLAPVTISLDVPIEAVWMFHDPSAHEYEEPAPDEILAEYHDGETIYPSDTLREMMLTELPDFPLCKEDCKGLCPGCGANLNIEKCTCKSKHKAEEPKSEGGADWKSALKKIKPKE